jgi:hypothetical protein
VRATSVLLTVVGFAVLTASAAAQTPPPNVLVGGVLGATDEGYAGSHDAFVTVGGNAGAQVPVTVTSALVCGSHRRQFRLNATVTRDATGAFQATRSYTGDAGRLRARVTLFGRTVGDEATGALSATGTLRVAGEPRATQCTKTDIGWRAHRTGTAPAATGSVPHGSLLVGATTGTDQHAPVSPILLRTAGDGASLRRAKWRVSVPCENSGDEDLPFAFRPIKLDARGRFVADIHAVDPVSDSTWDISVRFGGHVGADGASGYLRVVERRQSGGRTLDRCDTGKLRWSALLTPPPPAM